MNSLENNIISALKETESLPEIGGNISWVLSDGIVALNKNFLKMGGGKYIKYIIPMNQNIVGNVVEIISVFTINYKNQLSK